MKAQKLILLLVLSFAIVSEAKLRGSDERTPAGGWTSQSINSNYKNDANSPLSVVYKNLSAALEKSNVSNINFHSVQSQVVNGVNYKIEFSYEQNGLVKNGSVSAYVQSWTNTFQINSLNLQQDEEIQEAPIAGGYSSYNYEADFQSNSSNPLNSAFKLLNNKLSSNKLKFVKIIKVDRQVVNGMNYRIAFAYSKLNNQQGQGEIVVYVPINGKSQVTSFSVNKPALESSGPRGAWEDFDFGAALKSNEFSPFIQAQNKLQSAISENGFSSFKITKVQQQVVSGVNYKIEFSYTASEQLQQGEAVVYVQPWTNTVDIKNVAYGLAPASARGAWSDFDFNAALSSNEFTPFIRAHGALAEAIQEKGFGNFKITFVQQQLVSGVNYKIQFSYRAFDLLKFGEATVYVQPWTNTVEVKSVNYNAMPALKSGQSGAWEDFDFGAALKSNEITPFTQAHNTLAQTVSENGFGSFSVNFVQQQIVSGVNYKIHFSYRAFDQLKHGEAVVYVQSWTNTVEVKNINYNAVPVLQQSRGGWAEFDFGAALRSNELSPFVLAHNALAKSISEQGFGSFTVSYVQEQIVNGINFKIQFSYRAYDQLKFGEALIYVELQSNVVDIKSVNYGIMPALKQENPSGGWQEFDFKSAMNSNESSPFFQAHNILLSAIEKEGFSLINISYVQSQIVSGVNYKIQFQYRAFDLLRFGEAVIYVQQWTNTVEVKSINYNVMPALRQAIDGGWDNFDFKAAVHSNEYTLFSKASDVLLNAVEEKGYKQLTIESVATQIVAGVNYKIQFTYRVSDLLKHGEAIIFAQPWTNTAEVTSIDYNFSPVEDFTQKLESI